MRSGRTPKQIAKALESAAAKTASDRAGMADASSVRFDQLGIDFLIVDEAHNFRRHPATVSRAEGFSLGSSKRAADLSDKLTYLASRYGDRPHAMLMTGTPFVNSLAETFVWLTYLMPETLARIGIAGFDAFAATFVEYQTRTEVAPDGSSFRVATRPAAITNTPELMGLFDEVAHFVPSDKLDLPRPHARFHEVVTSRSEQQIDLMDDIVARAAALSSGTGAAGDNMLVICSDGRKVALDPRLVGVEADSPKLVRAADKIASIYHDDPECLQLVCLDMGTPKPDDPSTYGRLRELIVAAGVPAGRVRFIHEATTDRQRAALFASCRDGEVSVLFGSTSKVGVGVNVQRRLKALHHLDPAWNPALMEQREGRIIRYGNIYSEVDIYRHVVAGSFDAFMWQTNLRKASFVSALLDQTQVGSRARRVEDVCDIVLDYAQVLAAASENPLLGQRAEAVAQVRRLSTLAAIHTSRVAAMRRSETDEMMRARKQRERIDVLEAIRDREHEPIMAGDFERLANFVKNSLESNYFGVEFAGLRATFNPRRSALVVAPTSRSTRENGLIVALAPKHVRMRADRLAGYLSETITDQLERIDELIAEAHERIVDHEANARELRDGADSATFERADELAAARAHLARIEREIDAATELVEAA